MTKRVFYTNRDDTIGMDMSNWFASRISVSDAVIETRIENTENAIGKILAMLLNKGLITDKEAKLIILNEYSEDFHKTEFRET